MDYSQKFLGQEVKIQIDRPLGSKHPQHAFKYLLNYGFVPDTRAPDGEEIDAYLLGVDQPVSEFVGQCLAIIHRTDDDDDKLVIAPTGMSFTDQEIRDLTRFQEQYFTSTIIHK